MPLKLVIGRANAGKTGWILTWALEALEQGMPPTLVVPNLADARRLQRELSGKAPLGVRVLTPDALAEELWQLSGDGRRLIGSATRSAVMRKILAETPVPADLSPSAGAPGFEQLMIKTVRQSSPGAARAGTFAPAGILVVDLLRRYEDALCGLGLIEAEWIGSLLADRPPETGFLAFLRFTRLSPSHIALIRSLAEVNTVCAAVTWEQGYAPTKANDRVMSALTERAAEIQVATERHAGTELGLLSDRLYAGAGSLQPTGRLVLGEARGMEAEVALAAGLAGRAVRGGIAPERVAVVFGDVAPRLHALRNAMAAEGLEVDFDCPFTVGATSFGRALIALLTVAVGRGARTHALQFLQGPFSDADAEKVARLDTEWRQRRQTDDSGRVLAGLIGLGGSTGYVASLCRDVARVPLDVASAEKWQELADSLIATAVLSDSHDDRGVNTSAHRSVTTAIAEMASVPGYPFAAEDVLDVLAALPCAIRAEESSGRVQVIAASRIGSRRFDEVVVGGLTTAEFPLAARDTFASEVQALASERSDVRDEATARLEFYSLVTRARARLSLIRQTVDSDGRPQLASPLLEEVLDVYRGPNDTAESLGAGLVELETVRREDARSFMPVFTQGRREQRLLAEEALPPTRSVSHCSVSTGAASELVGGRIFSATEIGDYLQCPYRWFYSRVLRPGEIDAELDAAALGSRSHRLIADFYDALKGEGLERVTPETLPAALELFERSADSSERAMATPQGISEEIDTARARALGPARCRRRRLSSSRLRSVRTRDRFRT